MPAGKGWKAVADKDRLLQLMLPDKWKPVPDEDGESILKFSPPTNDKRPKAVLMVVLSAPRDTDPLQVTEEFAAAYAEDLPNDPQLAGLTFRTTDSGFVQCRGMRLALAGGTATTRDKRTVRQMQLIYIGEDRIVTVQFSATPDEYKKHLEDVVKIFASFQNLKMRATE
jgi:hypothetical protein